jgi:UDP-glucose 4-epimerase
VETTITELAGLCRAAARRPDHPIEYRPARPGEVGRNFARCDLARELLGYRPTVRIADGIPQLWEWFCAEVFRD